MPSTRDPVTVVQPGPGRLPANTVPANALIFPPTGNSDAALQAHITDPVGAHAASAISTTILATWANGTANPASDVQTRMADILARLGGNTAPTFTGQPVYAGATWSAVAGPLQQGLTTLFDAANARAVWVLDANPANKGDFVGANALINAVAALVADVNKRPILFLRVGTYNWDESTPMDRVHIVGAHRTNVFIQNLAGNITFSNDCIVENVNFNCSGDLRLTGNHNIVSQVAMAIVGNITISGTKNTLEHAYSTGGFPNQIVVSNTDNAIRDYSDCTIQLSVGADRTIVERGLISSVKTTVSNIVLVNSAENRISDITVFGLTSYNTDCFKITSSVACFSNIAIYSFTTPGVNFKGFTADVTSTNVILDGFHVFGITVSNTAHNLLRMDGTNIFARSVRLENLTSPNCSIIRFAGNSNALMGVTVATVTTPGIQFSQVDITANGGFVHALNLTSTQTTNQAALAVNGTSVVVDSVIINTISSGRFLVLGGTNCQVNGVILSGAGAASMQAGLRVIQMTGSQIRLTNTRITGFASNTGGATSPLLDFSGLDCSVDTLVIDTIGVTSNIAVNLITFNNSCSGLIKNVDASGNAGHGIFLQDIGGRVALENCSVDVTAATVTTSNAFHATLINDPFNTTVYPVSVRNCFFTAKGTGASNASATVFIEDCLGIGFQDVEVVTSGRAGALRGAGVVFSNCEFRCVNFVSGTAIQLFYGYGLEGPVSNIAAGSGPYPLVLHDCRMAYAPGNCNAAAGAGTGQPVVFFGGVDDTIVANHGPTAVDGLTISTYVGGLTAQHRDTLLGVDCNSTKHPSTFKDITIDLLEIPWSATGASRGGPLSTNAAVVAILGSSLTAGGVANARFNNLRIYNVKEPTAVLADTRHIVFATGATIDGLVIEGPASLTHGAGSFTGNIIQLSASTLKDISFGKTESIILSGTSRFVQLSNSKMISGVVRSSEATSAPTSIVHIISGNSTLIDTLLVFIAAGPPSSAVISTSSGADNSIVRGCHLEHQGTLTVPFVQLSNVTQAQIIHNRMVGVSGSTGPTAIQLTSSDNNHIIGNIITDVAVDDLTNGVIEVDSSSFRNVVSNNTLSVTLSGIWVPLLIDGDHNILANNCLINLQANTGTNGLINNGAGNVISGNMLEGSSNTSNVEITINSNTASNTSITGNVLYNRDGTHAASVVTSGTDTTAGNNVSA